MRSARPTSNNLPLGDAWIERTERLAPEPALALAALLDVPAPKATVPLLWHWLHLLERPSEAELGPDGHPISGSVLQAPGPGLRRMWAAGRVITHRPLRYGQPAARRSRVSDVTQKPGRSGQLTFVTIRHELWAADHLAVEEEQRIVYRRASEAVAATDSPRGEDDSMASADDWRVRTTPTLLFRFSALTYNAHRIHYDLGYARDIEGYPGLVVHGPLQAILMAEAIRAGTRAKPNCVAFGYRFHSPVLVDEDLLVGLSTDRSTINAQVRSGTGRLTATASWRRGFASRDLF